MTENVNVDDVPKELDLLNPTLAALHALGGSASKREIANRVIEDMGLSCCYYSDTLRARKKKRASSTQHAYDRARVPIELCENLP